VKKQSLIDKTVIGFGEKIKGVSPLVNPGSLTRGSTLRSSSPEKKGWALRGKAKSLKVDPDVMKFVQSKFDEAKKCGKKWNPAVISDAIKYASNKKGQVFRARQWLSTQDVRSIFHRLQTANKSKKNDEKGRGRGRPKMAVPPCEGDEDEDCEGEVDASEDVYNMLDSVNGYGSDDDSDDDDQAGPSTSGH